MNSASFQWTRKNTVKCFYSLIKVALLDLDQNFEETSQTIISASVDWVDLRHQQLGVVTVRLQFLQRGGDWLQDVEQWRTQWALHRALCQPDLGPFMERSPLWFIISGGLLWCQRVWCEICLRPWSHDMDSGSELLQKTPYRPGQCEEHGRAKQVKEVCSSWSNLDRSSQRPMEVVRWKSVLFQVLER